MNVCISKGNSKMGAIPSVSLPAVISCRKNCECAKECYALKLERIWKNVKASYYRNWEILQENPEEYWRQVREAVGKNRFFRFHVSGDIPDYAYLAEMVETAIQNPSCQILAFTKRYEIVNRFIDEGGEIPENLHIIFSGWRNLKMDNPYNLPEAHVRFKDGFCEAKQEAVECYGNCTECSVAGCGCWKLGLGEQVVFNQH